MVCFPSAKKFPPNKSVRGLGIPGAGWGGWVGGGADHEARLCFMVCPHPDDDQFLRFGVSGITP